MRPSFTSVPQRMFTQTGTDEADGKHAFSTHLDEAGVGHHLFGVHHIHQRLLHGHIADAGHVEAVHVLPPCQTEVENQRSSRDYLKP